MFLLTLLLTPPDGPLAEVDTPAPPDPAVPPGCLDDDPEVWTGDTKDC